MASNFLSQLIGKETGLVKERISESLAKKMAKAQKKEGKWRGLQSVLKTVANVALPGVGGAILGAAIDPIGRHFGAGARPSDIKATGDENIFGGRKAFKTARGGLQDAIDAYKQKNITSSILGFAGSEVGGAALEKWGGGLKDSLGFGDFGGFGAKNIPGGSYYKANPMPTETLASKVSTSGSTDLGLGIDLSGVHYAQGGMVNGFLDKLLRPSEVQRSGGKGYGSIANKDSLIDRLRGEYYTDQETGITDLGKSLATPWEQHLRLGGGESKYFDDESSFMESLGDFKSKYGNKYEQGGMVQKYQDGGQIKRTETQRVKTNPGDPTSPYETTTTTVWDTYEYDGVNWNKTGTGLETDPGLTNMTKDQMDKWRDEGRTENVGSSFMATQGEGINDFLRTPAVANLVNQAKAGNAGAMENLVEMARQMIPEYANMKNADIRGALKKNLTSIDLYGQGYQDVLSGTQTTLEGLQTGAQGARAKASSGAATSGIRTGGGGFRGADSISENLYAQAGEAYSGMQKGIQSEFDESFGGFESSILKIDG